MKKVFIVSAMLLSSAVVAHNPFQSNFFHPGFNDGFWRDFDRQFQRLDYEMNRLKNSVNSISSQSRQYFDQENNNYVVEVKISGLDKDDVNIATNKNMLIIKGQKNQEKKSQSNSSRSSSSFSHAMSIPRDGDKDNINAEFKDGKLVVTIPKLDQPKSQIQQIKIN